MKKVRKKHEFTDGELSLLKDSNSEVDLGRACLKKDKKRGILVSFYDKEFVSYARIYKTKMVKRGKCKCFDCKDFHEEKSSYKRRKEELKFSASLEDYYI